MIVFLVACVVLSLLIYLWLCVTDVKRSLCQNIMILFMTISNIGYLCQTVATNRSEAILSIKIIYIGGCFLPVLYFFTICEICQVYIKKRIKAILCIIQAIVYFGVCTIGYNALYYKSIEFDVVNGLGHIEKVYGPLHILYPLTMYLYFILSITIAIWASVKKKNINRLEIRNMMVCATLSVLVYAVYRLLKIDVQIMPLSYIILMFGAVVPIYHSNMYTVNENKDIIREHLGRVGFITFNSGMKYMGANEYARDIFPELIDSVIGAKLVCKEVKLEKLVNQVEEFHNAVDNKAPHTHISGEKFTINNRIFDTEIHTLNNFKGKCVGYTLELRDETEHYRMIELTERYNDELTKEVELKTERIRNIQEKTILGMAQMVESRDLSTGGHIKRTSDVVRIFARKLLEQDMGLDKRFLKLVIRSAPMHDLGKIGVDDAVLRKQGKFEPEEYEMMKKHAEIGGKMVRDIMTDVEEEEFVKVAYNVANYHHEKVNGMGYPCGLKGEEIPVEARIMALADVFDALVSKRCYKEAFSYDKAFSIIEQDAGIHFDKKLAQVFLQCREELEEYYNAN